MRFWLGLLLVFAVGYQLFFRYERWPSHDKPGNFYERDNLTGKIVTIKPGQQTGNLLARIWRDDYSIEQNSENISTDRYFDTYTTANRESDGEKDSKRTAIANEKLLNDGEQIIAKQITARRPPVPTALKKDTIASADADNNPPVPMAMLAADLDEDDNAFAVRQVDLNKDGQAEEIIQNALQSDGLLDISIVKNGREIFYARGKQIKLLSTHSVEGWEDIGIKTLQGKVQVYRYSPKESAYAAVQE